MAIFATRHYEAIAKVFYTDKDQIVSLNLGTTYHSEWMDLVTKVADMFQEDNPNFNQAHFLKACGMEDET